LGGRYFATLGLHLEAVREVGRLMAPRLLGVGVVQLNFLVNTQLAMGQPEGSLTAIQNAWALMTMPQVVIAQAIAIAALPTFSAQVARGRPDDMRASLAATLRSVILLSLPASLGLILLRRPMISLLLQGGEFGPHSTDLVAWALLWYAAGLVGHSVVEVLARAFYALHDTKTPVFIGAVAMSFNLGFSVAFSALFSSLGWYPHGGLALANSLATALEMLGLVVWMRRKLHGLGGKKILRGVGQAVVATAGMSFILWIWLTRLGNLPNWALVAGGIGFGVGVYALVLFLVGVEEFKSLMGIMLRKVRSSPLP
jgi:putative peptidoglycan lipid II flippase